MNTIRPVRCAPVFLFLRSKTFNVQILFTNHRNVIQFW